MSDSIETKGKTVDLAVSEALLQLGLRRDEVEIKVLEEPRAGLMGFIGARQAKVLVTKRRSRGGSRFGGRDRRRDDDHRAHDLTAEGSSGRGRGGRGGGRDGGRDEGGRGGRGEGRGGRDGARDERGGRGEGRGGRDGGRDGGRGRDERGARDERGDRNEARGGRGEGRGGRDGGRGRERDRAGDEAPRVREAGNEVPVAAEGNREERPDGQRSRRRRGGRGRGGRGRSGQGAPRDDQQPEGSVSFDAADDTFEVRGVSAEAGERGPDGERGERGERGGRGRRGGRGGRGRGGERGERGERAPRDFDNNAEAAPVADVDEFVVSGGPEIEAPVPREQAREQRSRREQHAAVTGVESDAPAAEPEVIETAVIANVAPRAKPRAWGGLGARREKPATGSTLPRVEQESPATAGSVFKPARTKAKRALVERPAGAAPQVGEIDSPLAGPTGTVGYGAPRGGSSYGSPRGGADEVIAAGIAATDYAKALAPVDEAGQPTLLTELTNGMLARAGFPCECDTIPGEYHAVKVSVDEDSAGMLIGRGGQTAEAIEHLVERMASNAAGDRVRMNLDINEYRIRREDTLRDRALAAIDEVRQTGEAYHMEPMDARERRVVHLLAEDLPDITTYTVVGSGGKHVVIARSDDDAPGDDDN